MTFFFAFSGDIQLVPDASILVHIALILLMVFVLNHTLFKPINRILEEREKRSRRGKGAAGDLIEKIEAGLSKYERTLRETKTESFRMIEEQRHAAMLDKQAKLDAVREDLDKTVADEKQSVRQQAEQARVSIETNAVQLASQIGSQILRRQI
jgi:F-type H+-transporting ATPase subunit b